MRIAIVGGGWVGCHLGMKLKDTHDVTIYEKNETLFEETSYNNQNRLHLGFHYARNYKTRKLCLDTFDKFLDDYGHLTEKVNKNLYCVPTHSSILDFPTYLQIFNDFDFNNQESPIKEIPDCITTDERYINFKKVKNYFIDNLKNLVIYKNINGELLNELKNEYDLVINATNNHLLVDKCEDCFYELTISLIYQKIKPSGFGALTMVDGPLFSIYPYQDELYTVTDVEHTPIKKFTDSELIKSFVQSEITEEFINNRKSKIENKILNFYPDFLSNFKYHSYFLSTKSKINDLSDERYPVIKEEDNLVNCFTGKIQGIYIIENYIKNIIEK